MSNDRLIQEQYEEIQALKAEVEASALALEEGTRRSIELQDEAAKNVSTIIGLQEDIRILHKIRESLFKALDEANEMNGELSDKMMDALENGDKAIALLKSVIEVRGEKPCQYLVHKKLPADDAYNVLLGDTVRVLGG